MTLLQIMAADDRDQVLLRTTDGDRIGAELAEVGIRFERCELAELGPDADQAAILAGYRPLVDRVSREGGYQLVDVVQLAPDDADPQWPAKADAARQKFLSEHTHDEDEVRFFVAGEGCFYLHLGERVYATVCAAGDLLSVPAGTTHWFDMGVRPRFATIRFFQQEDGWLASFTGDPIAAQFPSFDELLSRQP